MIIYEVIFPFEVDQEHGSCDIHYPTLKAAKQGIKEVTSNYNGYDSDGDIIISRLVVAKVTRELMCEIIDSKGGGWCAGMQEVCRIPWVNPRQEEEDH